MIHKTAIIYSKEKISANVKIGAYSLIGPNVEIDENSEIQSHVSIVGNTKIGKNNKIYPFSSIGNVIINENCEIGCGSTIDRGSLSNTIIGKNTYLDNQIHIAHNVVIGENSIIAGQVGILSLIHI